MGSLFASLTAAIAGLNAQSSAIGNISDNLANSQTTGYKAVGTNFEELVNASNATINNPGGVTATPAYQNDVQGSITTQNTSTYLAISGQGYFAVETAATDSTGNTNFTGSTFYTRQGDFTLDKNGYLVNGSGYYLEGYNINSVTGAADTSKTNPIQVSASLDNPVATSTVTYQANLPANATAGYTSATSTVQVYDSLGNTHAANYTWTKESANNTWDLQVTVPDANYTTTIPFTYNDGTSGTAGTLESIGAYASSSAAPNPYTVPNSTGSAEVDLFATFPKVGNSPQSFTLNFGTFGQSDGVSQFSDTNTAVTVSNFSQNGLAQGSFNNVAISTDGIVSINYSNGTNREIAQIPIVQFYAQDQLQRVSGGVYESTLSSGSPRYNTAGVSGAGTLASSSLESSNVDIATEFTDLIQAQQVYSANAKVVTTDNSLLQVTINMVQ
jgi:flagellar hook protein FlgE